MDLPQLLDWLADLAKDPMAKETKKKLKGSKGLGPEAAALLRFKEADQARSNLHRCVNDYGMRVCVYVCGA